MKRQPGLRDERTIAVENASYRWGYLLLAFGILAIVAYRSFVREESNFELLALVVASGILTTAYQGAQQVLSQRWLWITLGTVVLAAIIAAVMAFL